MLLANGYLKLEMVYNWSNLSGHFSSLWAAMPEDVKSFCILTYLKGRMEPIKRVLNNNYNIKVALKPHQTVDSLFPKPKDPIPKDQVCSIIYSIPCKDCDKLYIRKNKQKFDICLSFSLFICHKK